MLDEPEGELSAAAAESSSRPTELVTLLATDLVDSTRIKQMQGDQVAVGLIQEHQEVLRRLLAECDDGEEIETAGDSFLLVFAAGLSGVVLAVMGFLVLALLRKSAEAHFRMAQALRVSGQIGHRVETLAALQKAVCFYPDRDALRDEALAALALRDLVPGRPIRPASSGRHPAGHGSRVPGLRNELARRRHRGA